jgi:hypothetical protein
VHTVRTQLGISEAAAAGIEKLLVRVMGSWDSSSGALMAGNVRGGGMGGLQLLVELLKVRGLLGGDWWGQLGAGELRLLVLCCGVGAWCAGAMETYNLCHGAALCSTTT